MIKNPNNPLLLRYSNAMTDQETGHDFTDIPDTSWVVRYAPGRLRPYLLLARLDRPIGTWLLLWPCWWSLAMATTKTSAPWPDPWLLVAFGLGALVMRGAGCAWNDISDRNFDGQVERTRSRPIPSGDLSIGRAAAFMVLLTLTGLNILLRFNDFAILIGIMSLVPVAIYPFMKRITWWPQVFLGLAFNWGALLGWAAVRGEITLAPLLLYVGGIAWTLGYDTIYAHQDKVDDAIIGIKSSARRLGEKTRPALWLFYGTAIFLFGLAGWQAELNKWFYFVLVAAAIQLSWQATTVDIHNPVDCLRKFRSNTWVGWIVFAAGVLG